MHSRIMLPIVGFLCLSSAVTHQPAVAQKLNVNSDRGVDNNPSNQPIPSLSIDANTVPSAELHNSNDLKSVSDSIEFDRHPNRKRSINPLQYFEPPSLPSSIKVPVQHFR